jgi:outer membrane protein OmpA-like peptidoglycan-associated protein
MNQARTSPNRLTSLTPIRRVAITLAAVALLLPASWVASSSVASAGGVNLRFILPRTVMAEFPSGVADLTEPSGQVPPTASAFPGYVQKYVQDFNGTSLPPNWDVFSGRANGGTGSQWGSAHVIVGSGMLSLNTYQDPTYNNEWVSGGLCMCGAPTTYGAFFVRSRETGPGPTVVELLWPVEKWPPEIDFNETSGIVTSNFATLRYGPGGRQTQVRRTVDMTEWHTWGVVWTPTSIAYTVDGHVWGRVQIPSRVPHAPMTLNLQQQTWCSSNYACPNSPQSTQVDWVSVYKATPRVPVTVGSFAPNASTLTPSLREQVASLAKRIQAQGDLRVLLLGFSDSTQSKSSELAISMRRAAAVKAYLSNALRALGDVNVVITTTGRGSAPAIASNDSRISRAFDRRVSVQLS